MALICLLSSILMLVSCARGEGDNKQGEKVSSGLEHLNGLDFGGQEITYIASNPPVDDLNYKSIYVDGESADGDALNVALYERNTRIEALLNVKIVMGAAEDRSIKAWMGPSLLGGLDEYDIIAARQYDDIQLALDGVLVDINKLDQYGADYINWDREYWATNYIDALSFGNKTFWLTGDLSLRYTSGYYAIFVNANLYDTILKPKYGSIYDIVRNKQWTYDMLMQMATESYKDDGDDKIGLEDQIGLLFPVWDNTNGLAISAGVVFTRYAEDGTPMNNATANNSTLINFMNKCYELINTKGVYSFNPPSASYPEAMTNFASGKAVFVSARLNQAEIYLRDMNDDYYVIPCPMLDENQGQYYTGVHDAVVIYGINYNISDERIAASAATLEAMAYESYYNIRPIYYDSFLKFKYTRDTEAAEMIDIMHDNVYTDFVFIWQFADDMHGLGHFLRNNVSKNNAASSIKRSVTLWNNGLTAILEKIEKMDQ